MRQFCPRTTRSDYSLYQRAGIRAARKLGAATFTRFFCAYTWTARRLPDMSIRLPTVIAIGAASLVSVVALAQPLTCTSESPDVVCTEQGAVRGITEGRTLAFKGIPYAQPPVGPLRGKAPLPAANWVGVRNGGRYGAMCP